MNYIKIFFFLISVNLFAVMSFAQSNQSMTVTPSLFPDTRSTPLVVVEPSSESRATAESEIQYESKTTAPETKLSIGKASVVTTQERQNSSAAAQEKSAVNYNEQKTEKQEVPVNNSSLNPK